MAPTRPAPSSRDRQPSRPSSTRQPTALATPPAELQQRLGNRGIGAVFGRDEETELRDGAEDRSDGREQPERQGGPDEGPPESETVDERAGVAPPTPNGPAEAASSGQAGATSEPVTPGGSAAHDLVQQLQTAPAMQLSSTFDVAVAEAPSRLEDRRSAVEADLPEIEAPTGLPPSDERPPVDGDPGRTEVAGPSDVGPPPAEAGLPTPVESSTVDIPPAPRQPDLPLIEGPGRADPGGADGELARSGQAALGAVELDANGIPRSLEVDTTVDLTGDADPGRVTSAESAAASEVSMAATGAREAVSTDFGESEIGPDPDETTLSAEGLGGLDPGGSSPVGELPALPDEMSNDLDATVTPELGRRVSEATAPVDEGEMSFASDVEAAHVEAESQIEAATDEASARQLTERDGAIAAVGAERRAWTQEIDDVQTGARAEAEAERLASIGEIEVEREGAEEQARQHMADAEREAEDERLKAEREAQEEKRKAEEESSGFWGWARSAASALIDGLKAVVNAIYDGLRAVVKGIFDAAKKLVETVIDAARAVIVKLIEAYGAVLKAIVSVALAAFPEIRDRIIARIDEAIERATEVINAIADGLKAVVGGILDFLASTIDKILAFVQGLYNAAFTLVGLLVSGEWRQILEGLGNLAEALGHVWPQFDIAAMEELLGGNLDEPLPPEVLLAAGVTPPGLSGGEGVGPGTELAELPGPPWNEANVGVETVLSGLELSQELSDELVALTGGDGEVEFATSNDPHRTLDAVLGLAAPQPTEDGVGSAQATEVRIPDDGLEPRQRAAIQWDLMKGAISAWFQENWPLVAAGAALAIAGFIGLNILTGGAITAALPAIMSVLGPLFLGAALAVIASHVQDYVTKAWAGDVRGGGKALAKALAAGAIELIGWATFKVGSAAVAGARVAGRAAVRGAQTVVRGAVRAGQAGLRIARRGADFVIDRGRVLLRGLSNTAIGRAARRLDELAEGLLSRTRFRGFRIRIRGRRFRLEGRINPWVLLADGSIVKVDDLPAHHPTRVLDDGTPTPLQPGDIHQGRLVLSTAPDAPPPDIGDVRRLLDEATADTVRATQRQLDDLVQARADLDAARQARAGARNNVHRRQLDERIARLENTVGDRPAGMDSRLGPRLDDAVDDARLVGPDEMVQADQVPRLVRAQGLMNDLNRPGAGLGDGSTAYIVMAEQVAGGPGRAAVEIVEGTLHFNKAHDGMTAIFRLMRAPGPALPLSARTRLLGELEKLGEALEWARRYRAGEVGLDDLPSWATRFADDLGGLAP